MSTASQNRTRYALSGLSIRAIYHFLLPLLGKRPGLGANDFSATSEVVAIYDIDRDRVVKFLEKYELDIPIYTPEEGLDSLVAECQPDVLLIGGPDFTHCEHILCGLSHGLNVIVEKPMVINSEEARVVLLAEAESRGSLTVAHNFRYTSLSRKIRALLQSGKVGRVTNVEFVYNLDTRHGSSYFYRWNRERLKSGGLSVHKGVHHLDLINWLLGSQPETVFAFGALNYFGENGAHRPLDGQGAALSLTETRAQCPYFQKNLLPKGSRPEDPIIPGWSYLELPYTAQYPDDRYIYDSDIDIEDTYGAVIRYRNGAILSYACNFSTPWEGYTLAINGTQGRLEISHHTEPDPTGLTAESSPSACIVYLPLFGGREEYPVEIEGGGHGGADRQIQRDLFGGNGSQASDLTADGYAGAVAIATGEAIWRSATEGRPFTIRELLAECYRPA